jgi:hypothetical protein
MACGISQASRQPVKERFKHTGNGTEPTKRKRQPSKAYWQAHITQSRGGMSSSIALRIEPHSSGQEITPIFCIVYTFGQPQPDILVTGIVFGEPIEDERGTIVIPLIKCGYSLLKKVFVDHCDISSLRMFQVYRLNLIYHTS